MGSARFVHLSHGGFFVPFVAGSIVCLTFFSLLSGEGNNFTSVRKALVNPDVATANPAPRVLVFMVCAALVLSGTLWGEALLITCGCFFTYVGVASFAANENPLCIAFLIACCGIVTMILGDVTQACLDPVKRVLDPVFGTGLPVEIRASQALV